MNPPISSWIFTNTRVRKERQIGHSSWLSSRLSDRFGFARQTARVPSLT
jgi:hypothetical protein